MKIVKKFLLVILAIISLSVIAALFIKKDYAVEREVMINQPKQAVFDYLRVLKNQDNFSVWATRDPAMKKKYIGAEGAVGFIAVWASESDEVGHGEQEIIKITEGDRLDYELRFLKPFEATGFAYIITAATTGNQTNVKWGVNGKMPYLSSLSVNMENKVGKDLEVGLANLKTILEKRQ